MEEERITVDLWKHIPSGTSICNGFSNGYCTAPKEPGYYTLYERVKNATHVGWEWIKE